MRINKHVVLIGAGHAHLYIAKHAKEFVDRGIQITLVDPDVFWYSGLATGMLGGMYNPELDQVDPKLLIERNGGHFICDSAVGLDTTARTVYLASGKNLSYDALSFNVGSEVIVDQVAGIEEHAWSVKPVKNLWQLQQHLQRQFQVDNGKMPRHILVIGGGPTGCEISANIAALAWRYHSSIKLTLAARSKRLLKRQPVGASCRIAQVLYQRGIKLELSCTVSRIEKGVAMTEDGRSLEYDDLVIATGLRPPQWMRSLGLSMDNHGGLLVSAVLQLNYDERVFGAGDCISMEGRNLPKLGVFGVRQAPILLHNLLAIITGEKLKAYRPQKRYLIILNMGYGDGMVLWGPFYWYGRLSMWLKDRIDRRFLVQYRLSN